MIKFIKITIFNLKSSKINLFKILLFTEEFTSLILILIIIKGFHSKKIFYKITTIRT